MYYTHYDIMKKIISLAALMLVSINAFVATANAQFRGDDKSLLKVSANAFGGYNFLEKQPIGGFAVAFNAFCFRAEVEFSWTQLDTYVSENPERFMCFNPSVGVSFGNKHEFYAMLGATNFGFIETTEVSECSKDRFYSDLFHLKTKAGCNFALGKRLFINTELAYILPKHENAGYVYYQNLALRAGLGYRF